VLDEIALLKMRRGGINRSAEGKIRSAQGQSLLWRTLAAAKLTEGNRRGCVTG